MNLQEVLAQEAEVVVIGLSGRYDEALRDYDAADAYDVHPFETTYQAFRYLQEDVQDIQAIVCDVTTLSKEGFLFVHNVRREARISDLPIIAIDRRGAYDAPSVLQHGIDDCYVAPVSWEVLRERIHQIRAYRALLATDNSSHNSEDIFKIPTGKRIFDIVFSLLALIAFGLPMLAITAAIYLTSKGPILYRSKRIGTGYEEFEFLKFRSMIEDADQKVDQLRELNQYGTEGAFFKVKDDPRVTWIGRLIRNTSLDELPQLFNVLRGDMSIVGNRPLPLAEAEVLTSEEWSERFLAPAGITGKWQTSGRGKDTMSTEARMALDIEYARTYSAFEDLKILFKTLGAMKQQANV